MEYSAKNFDRLIGLPGLSEQILKNHFTLYQGYVSNANKVASELQRLIDEDRINSPEFAELQRRHAWEFNGMRLHELYFENLSPTPAAPEKSSPLYEGLSNAFASFDDWKNSFISTGMMRGIGWVVLYFDPATGRFFNSWINEHEAGHLAGAKPLLVMDVFEHAYMLDYQLKKADYIETFYKSIDWKTVEERFK